MPPNDRTLQYEGYYSDVVPVFQGKVTLDLQYLNLPLVQNISQLSESNPRLKGFGFDFDHQRSKSILQRENLDFTLWSSGIHNHQISQVQYPAMNHYLYPVLHRNEDDVF